MFNSVDLCYAVAVEEDDGFVLAGRAFVVD